MRRRVASYNRYRTLRAAPMQPFRAPQDQQPLHPLRGRTTRLGLVSFEVVGVST